MATAPRSLPVGKGGTKAINQALAGIAADIDAGDTLDPHTVANLPAAADNNGRIVYVSNGAAGQPCLAYSNGTNWLRILLGAAVSAT